MRCRLGGSVERRWTGKAVTEEAETECELNEIQGLWKEELELSYRRRNSMKRSIFSVVLILVMFLIFGGAGVTHAQKPFVLNTAWQPEHETFIPWYAKEKGWDKEEGLDLQLHFFDSGMAQMEALPAKQWVIAGMGGVPANVGALRYGTVLFASATMSPRPTALWCGPTAPS